MKLLRRCKNQIRAAVCLLLCVGILLPCIALSDNTRDTREEWIYTILVAALREEGVGKNRQAIACGILGNILAETGGSPYNYDPLTVGDYVSGVPTSGGICGWHNENWTKLNNWCKQEGYPWFYMSGNTKIVMRGSTQVTSSQIDEDFKLDMLEAQTRYIIYDLFNNVTMNFDQTRARILSVPNDIHGAWNVGYIFCCRYERPASMWENGAVNRGNNAQDFWNEYVNSSSRPITSGDKNLSALAIDEDSLTLPIDRSSAYSAFVMKGDISSNYPIRSVAVYVKNAAGKTIISFARDDWDCYDFSIQWDGPDSTMKFAKVSASGSYIYGIEATDVSGKSVSYQHVFYIGSATTCLYSFDCAGGTAIAGGAATFGSTLTLPTPEKRAGYLFDGWSDGTSTYQAGTGYTLLKTNVTFTAQWKTCPHAHWDTGVVTVPTIGTGGYTTYTCQDCGYVEQRDFTDPLPSDLKGDVYHDGYLTEADLHTLGRHIVGIELITDEHALTLADVNGDGSVSAADLTALAKLIN